jgi:hypothetical protein
LLVHAVVPDAEHLLGSYDRSQEFKWTLDRVSSGSFESFATCCVTLDRFSCGAHSDVEMIEPEPGVAVEAGGESGGAFNLQTPKLHGLCLSSQGEASSPVSCDDTAQAAAALSIRRQRLDHRLMARAEESPTCSLQGGLARESPGF